MRTSVGALCGQLRAVAEGVAAAPADQRLATAERMVAAGLAGGVHIDTGIDGVTTAQAPAPPWADCAGPDPQVRPDAVAGFEALSARVPLAGPERRADRHRPRPRSPSTATSSAASPRPAARSCTLLPGAGVPAGAAPAAPDAVDDPTAADGRAPVRDDGTATGPTPTARRGTGRGGRHRRYARRGARRHRRGRPAPGRRGSPATSPAARCPSTRADGPGPPTRRSARPGRPLARASRAGDGTVGGDFGREVDLAPAPDGSGHRRPVHTTDARRGTLADHQRRTRAGWRRRDRRGRQRPPRSRGSVPSPDSRCRWCSPCPPAADGPLRAAGRRRRAARRRWSPWPPPGGWPGPPPGRSPSWPRPPTGSPTATWTPGCRCAATTRSAGWPRAFNRMTRELQAYVQALTASRDQLRGHLGVLGDTLSSTHDLHRILQVILQTALAATGAQAGVVLLVDPATGDAGRPVRRRADRALDVPASRPRCGCRSGDGPARRGRRHRRAAARPGRPRRAAAVAERAGLPHVRGGAVLRRRRRGRAGACPATPGRRCPAALRRAGPLRPARRRRVRRRRPGHPAHLRRAGRGRRATTCGCTRRRSGCRSPTRSPGCGTTATCASRCAGRSSGPAGSAGCSACSRSTSTSSRRSTTRTGTPPATRCWPSSPGGSAA